MIRLMFFFVIAFASNNAPHAEPQWQTHESIYESVKSYVAQNINTTAEYEINIAPLSDRLNLALCNEPLQLFSTKLMSSGRSTVNVRCNLGKKWAIFVSVTITPFDSVVILTQPLQRGELVTQTALAIVRRDVSQLRGNYLTNIESVLNKTTTRTLVAGSVVSKKDFIEPKLVKRGDNVVISTNTLGIEIKMNGVAQSDGIRGQIIRVKNQSSNRVINAIVIDAGQVSVSR